MQFLLQRSYRAASLAAIALFLSACGGGSGDEEGDDTPPPSAMTVMVSGKITFDRIGFKTATGQGLNPDASVESPARQIIVEALNASNEALLAVTNTNASGDYSLAVPANRSIKIRAKAQMLKTDAAPTWNFAVRNNTNGNALYVLDSAAFDSGSADSPKNLRAASGWSSTGYVATRAAAPFAILDTIYQASGLILSAQPAAVFPALNLYWSATNKPTLDDFCTSSGDIGTTFYTPDTADADNCISGAALPAGIYVLGDFTQRDTDEFDQHVLAHEFGHYIEDNFSRSDSIGGDHGGGDRLDLRVAFSEGWGNAFAAMVLTDPVYRDSDGGVSRDDHFNLETDNTAVEGWFSELSIGEILWDVFDTVADTGDQVSLDFPSIFAVMTGAQKQTDAMTSLFSFADALRTANPAQAAGINALLGGEAISVSDAFGSSETNDGGSAMALPIYQDISRGQQLAVCSSGSAGERNKLGFRRFLRLTLANSAAALTVTATGAVAGAGSVAAVDPDIFIHRGGEIPYVGESEEPGTETISQQPFAAGTYIIEVYDYDLTGPAPHCMTVAVQG